eukprot:889631-Amorphochlora_amoeboformis.AAC.1
MPAEKDTYCYKGCNTSWKEITSRSSLDSVGSVPGLRTDKSRRCHFLWGLGVSSAKSANSNIFRERPNFFGPESFLARVCVPSALAALFVSTSLASDVSITSMTFSSDQTWYGANTYILSGQVFFEAGATLTIQKGTMECHTEARMRPIFPVGLTVHFVLYASFIYHFLGTLRYVRIWHGGADIGGGLGGEVGAQIKYQSTFTIASCVFQGSGKEINGLTLAGVGSSTTVEYVEVGVFLTQTDVHNHIPTSTICRSPSTWTMASKYLGER